MKISGAGQAEYVYLLVGGTKYISPAVLEVAAGDIVVCNAGSINQACYVYKNGETVASGTNARYNYEVSGNTEIALNYTAPNRRATIQITTE